MVYLSGLLSFAVWNAGGGIKARGDKHGNEARVSSKVNVTDHLHGMISQCFHTMMTYYTLHGNKATFDWKRREM